MGDAVSDTKGMRRTFIVPAIKAFDHYDFTRAKISCSLTWLVAKAFGSDSIPEELSDPFYRDQYSQEHLKPPLASLLQSAELYCRAGSLILRSDAVRPLLGHNAVIQALAQKGLYVTEQERLVTERDLASTPIHMSSHLALIDTLMMAYTVEMVSVERVVACVSRLGPAHSDLGPAHSNQHLDELPYDTEEAITTWINKVNSHLRDILVEEQKVRESSCPDATTAAHKSRYRREAGQRGAPLLPLVDSLLKDNTDGCALATLLHYYCPSTLPLEDVCLKETMSLADSLYNLQLVQDLCRDNLNHCCHFSLEDMLYAHASIKSNYLVFMAELFWWFEVVKPSFVQPRVVNPQVCEPVVGVAPVCSPANHSNADTPGSPANHRQAVSPGLPDNASLTPNYTPSGIIRRSASMSYVDGSVGTWPKERRSSSRGISFEIPLDGDPSVDPCMTPPPRGMRRSASSEGLGGFKVHHASRGAMRRHVSLTPVTVNGQAAGRHIPEEDEDSSSRDSNSQKPLGRQQTFTRRNQSRYSNGVVTDNHPDSDADLRGNCGGGGASPTTPPSIEEALKIIHATERPHGTLGAGDHAFFLHRSPGPDPGPDHGPQPASGKGGADVDELTSASTEEVDTGIHVRTEDIQGSHDEDSSSLRDYSDMDPDWDPPGGRSCPLPQTPDREGERGRPGGAGGREGGTASPSSSSGGSGGVRMTSFAEQKFRKLEGRSSGGTTPESSELNLPYTHSSQAATPEARSPAHPAPTPISATPSPRDPSHMLASEMVHLKMKLEEKRRAIEAQKKKVEEAFTRHRQRMGRTAFLNVVRRKGVMPSPCSPPAPPSPGPGDPGLGRPERCKPDGAAPKSPCEDGGGVSPGEVDLVEYTHSIERLNTSLGLLQTEMQRLARQQDRIMAMRDQGHTQQDHTQQDHTQQGHTQQDHTQQGHTQQDHTQQGHTQQDHTQQGHTQQAWVIPAPAPSPHRQLRDLRSCSVAGRGSVGSLSPLLSSSGSPLGPRRSPAALKRRPASFHARTPRTPRPSDHRVAPFSRMLNTPTSVDSLPRLRRFCPSQTQLSSRAYLGHDERPLEPGDGGGDAQEHSEGAGGGTGEGREEEEEGAGTCCLAAGKPSSDGEERREGRRLDEGVWQTREEGLSQPVSDGVSSRPAPSKGGGAGPLGRRGLVEVPLSVLKPLDGHGLATGEGGAGGETDAEDQKMCCGFFFKDDLKGEEDMAVKRAALLERRERREKEALERRQQQELEQEQRKEATRLKVEEEQQKREEEKSRRDYIKNEYMRRKQLKLMDDMDDVIKPRPGSLKKKPRPKSIHRDVMESPKPPVRATGVRPRGYSVSSASMASLNPADHDGTLPDKRTPRPDSAEGFLSPCPSGSRNEEKDWEVESTTSSTPSNSTEYTGPKLYKEPSAKSNKHIIQNALAHCCLAGKVNEGQKNKILDEMEKSEANNFLILFRDAGCQFRSVYAYFPETEHMTKLAGIGPRSLTTKMVDGLYKYNSDRKQFSAIPAKTMSASVDAITMATHLWQTKKQSVSRSLQTK